MAIWDGVEQKQFPLTGPLNIPKKFHVIWNHTPMPRIYLKHLWKLQDLHPDWDITLWNDQLIRGHLDGGFFSDDLAGMINDAYATVDKSGKPKDPRQVSDLVRLGVVSKLGGVYLDCDYTPMKNFEPLLIGAPCVLTCPSPTNIANGFIAADSDDPFIEYCLSQLMANYYSRSGIATHRTGPRFITQMYKDFLEFHDGLAPARLLPKKFFYPYSYNRLDQENQEFPEAYAIHRWASKKGLVWVPEEAK